MADKTRHARTADIGHGVMSRKGHTLGTHGTKRGITQAMLKGKAEGNGRCTGSVRAGRAGGTWAGPCNKE